MASFAISYLIEHAQLAICELKSENTKENKRKTIQRKKIKVNQKLNKRYTKI